ncbi:MAG: family 20 glycosylhydrolase [Planctomycetes bacterium]|nr:family 20 glycosylhydrolase [Planctomycetota bacterium]
MSQSTILPIPQDLEKRKGYFDWRQLQIISFNRKISFRLKKHLLQFKDWLELSGCNEIRIQAEANNCDLPAIHFALKKSKRNNDQAYTLEVDSQEIHIHAAHEQGLFYALQSLRQLCYRAKRLSLCHISDKPSLPNRGYMLDISRSKVPKMETLKKIIRELALFKFNQFQIYIEHTFQFPTHEDIWKDSSALTSSEILELDEYCHEYYIDFVPNFNSFGHFERWLKHPAYKHYAEIPEGSVDPWGRAHDCGSTLAADHKSLKFINGLYADFLPNFTSSFFNAGCDETWELGKGRSKAICKRQGVQMVYLDYLKKIQKVVSRHHKTMMFWGDIILKEPKLVAELPNDMIALNWGYESDHPFKQEGHVFRKAGVPYYVCPGTSTWNAILGRVPNMMSNIQLSAESAFDNNASGLLLTDWGDGGHHQYLPFSAPGIIKAACSSWNVHAKLKESDLAWALETYFFDDTEHCLGKAFMKAGQIYKVFSGTRLNGTYFHDFNFLSSEGLKKLLPSISDKELHRSLLKINEISELINSCTSRSKESQLVKRELKAALDMARVGIMRALVHKGESHLRADLLKLKKSMLTEHQYLWLQRNRRGGLQESLGFFPNSRQL